MTSNELLELLQAKSRELHMAPEGGITNDRWFRWLDWMMDKVNQDIELQNLMAASSDPTKFWIGVDLDKTLAHMDEFRSWDHIGPPNPVMVARIKQWLADGLEVRIFTARVDGGHVALGMGVEAGRDFHDVKRMVKLIQAYTMEHIGVRLPITNKKDFGMIEIWDDVAVRVVANEGSPCCDHHHRTDSLKSVAAHRTASNA